MRRLLGLLALWLVVVPVASAADLTGTWYVLVHYKDDASGKPDAMRWEDRIWIFERSGDELTWKEYPIVVFADDEGRFERSKRGYSRVIGAWEPNPGQRAQIASGLEVNTRGSKTKSLRGSDAAGWKSVGSAQPVSANVITYVEIWGLRDAGGKPVFLRNESLGSAAMESLEGGTRYETQSASDDGSELRGSFERDGARHGTFRMIRAGAVSNVGKDGKTPNEKMRERIEQQVREQLQIEGALTPEAVNDALDAQSPK